ncbi:LAMI_0H10022g1_1 [Lachancea mirantina]|uniref:LAMI_0H10022g1_1 n=1 Tax=Lachancea mirantina TaxID=1230905 RepID=A0A1G4KGJ1_9SACH|nr:LAMI_0H10022g1_1 [Lachancea mirantina]
MSRNNRKRGSTAQPKFVVEEAARDRISQVQEFQELLDSQKTDFERVRAGYSQQNVRLARCNSTLLIRIREMEKNVSELVQENVTLRSRLSVNEARFKERLDDQVQMLERGILQRFEEIFHMFASIRRREGLRPSAVNFTEKTAGINEPRSILKRSRPSSSRTQRSIRNSGITFSDLDPESGARGDSGHTNDITEESSTRKDLSPQTKKRRRSSRRESLFSRADFEFLDEGGRLPDADDGSASRPTADNETPDARNVTLPDDPEVPEDQDLTSLNDVCNFTTSIIDCSIPEEAAEMDAATGKGAEASSSKIGVYQDHQDETNIDQNRSSMNHSTTTSISDNTFPQQQLAFLPIKKTSQQKIKHSMKSRGGKKMIDEVMPATATEKFLSDSRVRRTRGKAVNYTLPSLRAKMRRPSEKFVDATTTVDIHDLQVRGGEKRARTKSKEPTPETTPSGFEGVNKPEDPTASDQTVPEHSPQETGPAQQSTDANNEFNSSESTLISRPPTSSTPRPSALKDITNKSQGKSLGKTKKLFKRAIIGDIDDENSVTTENAAKGKTTNFRLHGDDLSAFHLLDDLKNNGRPRTHRAQAKRPLEKRKQKSSLKS